MKPGLCSLEETRFRSCSSQGNVYCFFPDANSCCAHPQSGLTPCSEQMMEEERTCGASASFDLVTWTGQGQEGKLWVFWPGKEARLPCPMSESGGGGRGGEHPWSAGTGCSRCFSQMLIHRLLRDKTAGKLNKVKASGGDTTVPAFPLRWEQCNGGERGSPVSPHYVPWESSSSGRPQTRHLRPVVRFLFDTQSRPRLITVNYPYITEGDERSRVGDALPPALLGLWR